MPFNSVASASTNADFPMEMNRKTQMRYHFLKVQK